MKSQPPLQTIRLCLTWVTGAWILLGAGCTSQSTPPKTPPPAIVADAPTHSVEPELRAFCGDCHATPDPAKFPRDAWPDEVARGYEFYYLSGRSDLHIPAKSAVVQYYRQRAPKQLDVKPPPPLDSKLRFVQQSVDFESVPGSAEDVTSAPALACIRAVTADKRLDPRHTGELLLCDMRGGTVARVDLTGRELIVTSLIQLGHPAHIEACDLNRDGRQDYVIADLGSFLPEDHDRGQVFWLDQQPEGWQAHPLAQGLSRVADVQPGDFDGDGDLDLVVAEFGWLKTGRLLLLVNQAANALEESESSTDALGERGQGGELPSPQSGSSPGAPSFELRVLDPRHGSIHVPSADFNQDGRLDFVALVAQEYESVELFLNQGQLRFETRSVFDARDPSFGSSGIELCDLDGDGDLDILYTNGDTLDSHYLKPYHAIHLLENRGDEGWHSRELAKMPGAMRAVAADLDGDGDLDVAASAMIAKTLASQTSQLDQMASLLWIEQIEAGQFETHTLERGNLQHAALEAADLDGDGDIDLAVGNFSRPNTPALTIWWNQTGEPR